MLEKSQHLRWKSNKSWKEIMNISCRKRSLSSRNQSSTRCVDVWTSSNRLWLSGESKTIFQRSSAVVVWCWLDVERLTIALLPLVSCLKSWLSFQSWLNSRAISSIETLQSSGTTSASLFRSLAKLQTPSWLCGTANNAVLLLLESQTQSEARFAASHIAECI